MHNHQGKKVYVISGNLRWVGHATGAMDAIRKTLDSDKGGHTLDPDYFYIDERGFRVEDCQYRVPLMKGLKAAGCTFEDVDDEDSE